MSLAAEVITFVETFCVVPEGRGVGKPMRLMPWQKDFLRKVFDNPHGTRRAILSVGRKNAKTTLIAALMLAYLIGPLATQNSQVFSGALSREQAALVFGLMAKMIRLHADLAAHIVVRDTARELLCTLTGVKYRALSADASTAMGTSPVAFVFDELGQVFGPHCLLFDALHSGQGAHANPIEFVISTQAANDGDALSLMIDDARRSNDPHTVCEVHEAPESCDLLDESAWALANPAIDVILERGYLRQLAEEASRLPSREPSFRNLILNQRVQAHAPFISRALWVKNATPPKPYDGNGPVFGGLDLSGTTDLTALVLVWRSQGIWQVQPHFWTPQEGLAERARRDFADYVNWHKQGHLRTTPGKSLDYDSVSRDMLEILSDFNVQALAFDRWRIDQLKAALAREGGNALAEKMVPFGQGFQGMAPALEAFEAEVLNGRIAHGNHPVLAYCVANATTVTDPAGNRKLDKSRSSGRIDGAVALAMAMGIAARDALTAEPPKKFQMMFV